MPLQRRIPKFGFKNPNRVEYRPINIERVVEYLEAEKLTSPVTIQGLIDAGLAKKKDLVKLLAKGDLETALEIEAHAASKSAVEKVEKAGGTITIIK